MSEPKHTPDKLVIMEGFGQKEHLDTRYYIGSPDLPQAVFVTSGGNDKALAERLLLVWNSRDDLLKAGEELKDALVTVLTNINGTLDLGPIAGQAIWLAQKHWDEAVEGTT